MSMLGNSTSGNTKMSAPPIFHEFKKQASFFLKEKIKTARLALTDVTPAQLLAEEATNENPGGPDARTMKMISRAAFEVDDYWRIVHILHKRLGRFEKRNWRGSYKALVVLEHLLTHGPESVAEEFQSDGAVIKEMEKFQYIDEKGFNWGLTVRKKSERILKLLEKGPLLKEERDKARKISRGIEGFGSFNHRTTTQETLPFQDSSSVTRKTFDRRCNSHFIDHTINQDEGEGDFFSVGDENRIKESKTEKPLVIVGSDNKSTEEKTNFFVGASKENLAPEDEGVGVVRNGKGGESKPLLDDESRVKNSVLNMEDQHHPFDDVADHLTAMSLLSTTDCR